MVKNQDRRRPRVLVCERIHQTGLNMLQEFVDVEMQAGLSRAQLLELVSDYDALVMGSDAHIDAQLLRHGLNLKFIIRDGSGLEHVDVVAARERNIQVIDNPEPNTLAVAEHTMGLMLALARNIPRASQQLKSGTWDRSRLLGTGLSGKTLGIIGFGRIGRQVALRAEAFGMKILVNQTPITPELLMEGNVELVDLFDLLARSDFVTLHVSLRSETENMIGAHELAQMKNSAYLINTARGAVIDDNALLAALQEGQIAGAALDVFSGEPDVYEALIKHPHVIATPHIAASTEDAQEAAAVAIAEELIEFFEQVDVETVLPLRVVPMERVKPHEHIDPKRVNRLAGRLEQDGVLGNPPIVTEVGDGTYMVLDGATRTAAMNQLDFPHAIVQVVSTGEGLGLKTWYHVIQQIRVYDLLPLLQALPDVSLQEVDPVKAREIMFEYGGLCYLHTIEDRTYVVQAALGANRIDALNQFTHTYIEASHVDRTLEEDIFRLKNEYEEMAAVVIFPEYTVDQVIQSTLKSNRLFPAGITRFLIPGRILRLNADLGVIKSRELTLREKNRWLHEQLVKRQAQGGIRYYGEPVVLLDE
jgi:phosphoglycerate dehydrogenase-like enzyme